MPAHAFLLNSLLSADCKTGERPQACTCSFARAHQRLQGWAMWPDTEIRIRCWRPSPVPAPALRHPPPHNLFRRPVLSNSPPQKSSLQAAVLPPASSVSRTPGAGLALAVTPFCRQSFGWFSIRPQTSTIPASRCGLWHFCATDSSGKELPLVSGHFRIGPLVN